MDAPSYPDETQFLRCPCQPRVCIFKVDPDLAHFIQVGRFAHSKLNDAGSAFGFLVSLRPVPPPPTPAAAAAGEATGSDAGAVPPPSTTQWRLTQLLTVEEPVGTDGSMVRRVYETVRF